MLFRSAYPVQLPVFPTESENKLAHAIGIRRQGIQLNTVARGRYATCSDFHKHGNDVRVKMLIGATANALIKSLRDGPKATDYPPGAGSVIEGLRLLDMSTSGWIRIEKVLQFLEFSRCCSLDDAFRKGTPYTKGDLLKMLEIGRAHV